jgi:phage baseplate assembly protein W
MDNTVGYSDLDLTFNAHPIKKDLMLVTGENAVIRSLKNLILTNHYETPFDPSRGSNVRKLLFDLMTPFTAATLSKEIEYTIKNYEPRVNLNKVTVTADYDNNAYSVSINFYIENLVQPFTADFLLYRLR